MIPLIEEWRPVKEYEGYYEVSNLGNIRSVSRVELQPIGRHEQSWTRTRQGRDKAVRINNLGYVQVILYKDGKGTGKLVHRLVAESFVENPLSNKEVNHKDGVRDNNIYMNLEWVTRSENALHGTRVLGKNRGSENRCSKLTEEEVLEISKLLKQGESQTEISKLFNTTSGCVYRIAHGHNWSWLTGIGKGVAV